MADLTVFYRVLTIQVADRDGAPETRRQQREGDGVALGVREGHLEETVTV